jgi:hypothetical protein
MLLYTTAGTGGLLQEDEDAPQSPQESEEPNPL